MAKAATPVPDPASIPVYSKLAPDVVDELDAIAKSNGITRAAVIAIAITGFVARRKGDDRKILDKDA